MIDCDVMDEVEVDSWITEFIEDVKTDWTVSVVDSGDEVLRSVGEVAAVVICADKVLGAIDVETVSVDKMMIVVASADGVVCAMGVGVTCVLISVDVVGSTRLDVGWIRADAVARMPIAAATASSISWSETGFSSSLHPVCIGISRS